MIGASVSWRRSSALLVALLCCSILLSPLALGPDAKAAEPCRGADCDVVGDPDDAQYVGTGGLLLPADTFTGTSDARAEAATCGECSWALVPMCKGQGQGGGVQCGPAASSCPKGQFRRIVLLLRPQATEWEEIGLVCMSPSAPTTVEDLARRMRDVVVEKVPAQHPSSQPRGGTLVHVPAIFDSGQPASLGERRFDLVGFAVQLEARAEWVWRFGDGGEMVTDQPGGSWPDRSVNHEYIQAGRFPITVVAEWRAWFTVDGLGPFPVAGAPVIQVDRSLAVVVREARAELIQG